MRDIKFRLWDKSSGVYEIDFYAFEEIGIRNMDDANKCGIVIEQYTGLKDKNGVEIYEGDIVRIEEVDEDSCCGNTFEYTAIVAYENGGAIHTKYVTQYRGCFCLISDRFYLDQALLSMGHQTEREVIGNIHEGKILK